MKKIFLAGAIAAAMGIALPAAAQGYVGLGLGSSHIRGVDGPFISSFGTNTVSGADGDKASWKIYGGYKITPNLAIEGQYADLGKRDLAFTGGATTLRGDFKTSQYSLAVVGILPLANGFALFGKLGVSQNSAKATTPSGNDSVKRTSEIYGLGVSYDITQHLVVRAEYEDFGKFGKGRGNGTIHGDKLSIGLHYAF